MSIFGKIAAAIFGGSAHAAPVTEESKQASGAPQLPQASAPIGTAPVIPMPQGAPASPAAATAATAGKAPAAMARVDVAAVLDKIEEDSDEDDLDWRKSIVDLMKLLKLDSSIKARKELATELGYTEDMGDSAKMNVWLHKQVMTKLAENGGTVPASLKH
jgi:hypothetical protein